MIVAQSPKAGKILCILDALDECEQSGKGRLINSLNKFYSKVGPYDGHLKFIVTSRPYLDIEERFGNLTIRLAGEDETELIRQEIDLVIRDRVSQIAVRKSLNHDTQKALEQRLLRTEHRTYLWLYLTLDSVEKAVSVRTPKKMGAFIDKLPNTIYEAYEAILHRSPDREKAKRLLHIVLAAVRPLTLREMNIALNIEMGQNSIQEVDLDPEDSLRSQIKNVCGLFVSVCDSQIYLLHQTAKEFLVSMPTNRQLEGTVPLLGHDWRHNLDLLQSNCILAKICLTYLCFKIFEDEPFSIWDKLYYVSEQDAVEGKQCFAKHDLLDYAVRYWNVNFRMAIQGDEVSGLWRRVCTQEANTQEAKRFRSWSDLYWTLGNTAIPIGSCLALGCYFGHNAMVERLINDVGCNVDSEDKHRQTPLMWAAKLGHGKICQMLLSKDAQTERRDFGARTALLLAVMANQDTTAAILAAGGASADARDYQGSSPLSLIKQRRDQSMLYRLLNVNGDTSDTDTYDQTLLKNAALGRTETIRELFKMGASIRAMGPHEESPLNLAASGGHISTVRLLLEHGADVNHKNDRNETALNQVVQEEHHEVVRTLLDAGADPNIEDCLGHTPLQNAYTSLRGKSIAQLLTPVTLDISPCQCSVCLGDEEKSESEELEDEGSDAGIYDYRLFNMDTDIEFNP